MRVGHGVKTVIIDNNMIHNAIPMIKTTNNKNKIQPEIVIKTIV